jgi:hypothetical protein
MDARTFIGPGALLGPSKITLASLIVCLQEDASKAEAAPGLAGHQGEGYRVFFENG